MINYPLLPLVARREARAGAVPLGTVGGGTAGSFSAVSIVVKVFSAQLYPWQTIGSPEP
jgi:hypothetical protein